MASEHGESECKMEDSHTTTSGLVPSQSGIAPSFTTPFGSTVHALPAMANPISSNGAPELGGVREPTTTELVTRIRQTLLAQTQLPGESVDLVTFWVISTWFQQSLTVLPCLVITGPAHDATRVLHVLQDICPIAALLSGFRRIHLGAPRARTNLILEPNLDKRTAALLGDLTYPKVFFVTAKDDWGRYARSTAIWAGESPEIHKIQNSIPIHIPPSNVEPVPAPAWLPNVITQLPADLKRYRDNNLNLVPNVTVNTKGLSSETAVIATELGRCLVGAPELQRKLAALLSVGEKERLSEMSNTIEAIVLGATRALSRQEREHAYAKEIAAEANRLLEALGERVRLTPPKVGRLLIKLGLRTHELSQEGNGLTFDKTILNRMEQLAAMYNMEDMPAENKILNGSQITEK